MHSCIQIYVFQRQLHTYKHIHVFKQDKMLPYWKIGSLFSNPLPAAEQKPPLFNCPLSARMCALVLLLVSGITDLTVRNSSHISEHRARVAQTNRFLQPRWRVLLSLLLLCVFTADIDECTTGRHACGPEQMCYNTRGSYTCNCLPGYQRNGDHCIG